MNTAQRVITEYDAIINEKQESARIGTYVLEYDGLFDGSVAMVEITSFDGETHVHRLIVGSSEEDFVAKVLADSVLIYGQDALSRIYAKIENKEQDGPVISEARVST